MNELLQLYLSIENNELRRKVAVLEEENDKLKRKIFGLETTINNYKQKDEARYKDMCWSK